MKKLKYISIFLLLIFSSCDDLLDEAPRDLIDPERFYQSETDGIAAIAGIYSHLLNGNTWGIQMDILFGVNHDLLGPTRVLGAGHQFMGYRWDASTERFRVIWRELYQGINDANLTIERIQLSDIPREAKDDILGEATFLRAFIYYYMVAMYGDVPLFTEPNTGENFAETGQAPRTPKDQIYQQIIADCELAETLLPDRRTSEQARATKWAAKALKMKTYLWMQNWTGAKAAAEDIIQNSHHRLLPNYDDIFDPGNEFNDEIIYQFDHLTDQVQTNRAARFSPRAQDDGVPAADRPFVFTLGFGFFTLYKSFAKTYADNDLRKPMSVYDQISEDIPLRYTYLPKGWRVDEPRGNTGLNYKFYRMGDLYLNLAEAENEISGGSQAAHDAINEVRRRAGIDDLMGLSQDELREAIQLERAKELVGEGNHRKLDLVRWGTLGQALQDRMAAETADPDAAQNNVRVIELTANNFQDHMALSPIPASEILLNPNLTQNPGY